MSPLNRRGKMVSPYGVKPGAYLLRATTGRVSLQEGGGKFRRVHRLSSNLLRASDLSRDGTVSQPGVSRHRVCPGGVGFSSCLPQAMKPRQQYLTGVANQELSPAEL